MSHRENLSYEELLKRLVNEVFGCKECSKQYSFEVDKRFWNEYIKGYYFFGSTPEGFPKKR